MQAVKFVFDNINGSVESLEKILYKTLAATATPFFQLQF